MNIIIVGAGQVGCTLAEQLIESGHNITVIDTKYEKVKFLTDKIDAMGIVGNGASHSTLAEAHIKKADLLIAVTNSDELNILCCIVAKKSSSCKVIARVRNHIYNSEVDFLKDELGLAMVINPELCAAEEIARVLRFPSALSIETFGKGRVELLRVRLPEDSAIIGMSVKDVMIKYKSDILFATVERQDEAYIAKGNFVFEARDIISIIASPKQAQKFFTKIGYKTEAVKDAIIVGCGEITKYICEIFEKSGVNIKIVEKDPAVCDTVSEEFPFVTVANRDPHDTEAMIEEGLTRTDAFLALTDSDDENILLSLYGRRNSKCKTVTKIKRVDYDDIIDRLDLDTVIYPKNIVADMILRFVRSAKNTLGSNMENLYNITKGEIEVSEFIIGESSRIVSVPIMDLKLKHDLLIAAILRKRTVIIPRGYDTIEIGDSVVIVSRVNEIHDITDILEK